MKVLPFRPLFFLILLITFLVHLSYIPNGFTWLDHGDIERSRAVVPMNELPTIFSNRYGDTGFYRPMVTLLNSIDAAIYKDIAPGYHLTNVLLHVAVTATIPLFLAAFFSLNPLEILLIVLFFGIHPVSSLPVGAISYRQELLVTLSIFLSVFFHSRARQTKTVTNQFLTVCAIILSVFSKETAVVLIPAFILLWEWQRINNHKKTTFHTIDRLLFLEIVVLAAYSLLRLTAVPDIWRIGQLPLSLYQAITLRLFLLGKLLITMLSPFTTPLSDAVSFVGLFHPIVLFATVFIGIAAVILKKVGLKNEISIGILLLLISLAPGLNIIPVPRISSMHYAYVALPCFAVILVFLLRRIPNNTSLIKYAKILGIFLWFAIAIQATFLSGFQYKNDLTLFKPETEKDTNFLEGYFYLGNFYLEHKEYQLAQQSFTHALKPQTNFHAYTEQVSVLTNFAAVYYATKQLEKADQLLEQAQSRVPTSQQASIRYNRALLANEQKDYQRVIMLLSNHTQENPLAMLLLAEALHNLKQDSEAKKVLKQSLPYWPSEQRQNIEKLIETLSSEASSS